MQLEQELIIENKVIKLYTQKVAVIVPVYNVEKYLVECLDSILNQTLIDIEIICVNDASPDNSLSILEEYAAKDERIQIISHEKNLGLGPARNTGVTSAKSPYIAFVDSDDYIAPNMMEKLYNLIDSNDVDLSWCATAKVSETGEILDMGKIPDNVWTPDEVLDCAKLFPSIQTVTNKMFRRDLIKDIEQLPILIEDEPTIAQFLMKCTKIITINEPLYFYRHTPESLSNPSSYTEKYWEQFFNDYRIYFDILKQHQLPKRVIKKQIILRCASIFWRIKTYDLINSDTWTKQSEIIKEHLNKDSIYLKEYCSPVYHYLMKVIQFNFFKKLQKELIIIGLVLTRRVWPTRCRYVLLPLDMIKVELPKIIIIIRNILDYFEILFFKILAEIYKIFNRNPIWLIGERHDTAEENGLYFYRYLKTEQPREKSYYVIDKRSKQYNSVKDFKDIIQFNSLKHKILFLVSSFYVTSHNHYCIPKSIFGKKRYLMPTSTKNVFLDHGITYADVSEFYGKKNSGIDLFICGAQPEEDYVKAKFGYKSSEVAYTGFARFDGLHDFKIKKQILVMPTWRKNIYNLKEYSEEERELFFKNSEFYKTFQSLLTNQELFELLEKFHYRLIFYPHYEIHNFLQYFSSDNKNIVIASKDKYYVQALLRDSALLITDTSSVHFDFAYMFKPVIYYKFDKESFINSHLPVGYYIHETMGFGEVVEKEQPLITLIENYLKNDCTIEDVFSKRVKEFYPLYDIKNCERIYNSIVDNK